MYNTNEKVQCMHIISSVVFTECVCVQYILINELKKTQDMHDHILAAVKK